MVLLFCYKRSSCLSNRPLLGESLRLIAPIILEVKNGHQVKNVKKWFHNILYTNWNLAVKFHMKDLSRFYARITAWFIRRSYIIFCLRFINGILNEGFVTQIDEVFQFLRFNPKANSTSSRKIANYLWMICLYLM